MSCYNVPAERGWKKWVPFGLGSMKPKHFRDMGAVLWQNADNLSYAWKVLSRGVCDGCALGVAGFHDWTIPGVHLCMTRLNLLRLNTMPAMDPDRLADVGALASLDNTALRALGRLAYPMLRRRGENGFRRVTWDEALALTGSRIRATDPRRLAFFITSRGLTNEVYYVAQKAARSLGTNNIDTAARLCHSPSTVAMKDVLGVQASTCSYADWFDANLIVFIGSNPANDQPVSTKYLHLAKERGAKVVLVNPYLEPGMRRYWVPSTTASALFGTDIADWWFPVAQGGDIAFLTGVLRLLDERGALDEEFLGRHTEGFDAVREAVRVAPWDQLVADAGLPRDAFERMADLCAAAGKGILIWSMGVTQHPFGADAVRAVLNLALARGWIGRDGCGVMPIRGHSSVQGGAEMGAYPSVYPGAVAMTPERAAELSAAYGFSVPDWPGLTTVQMIQGCAEGSIDVMYAVGGNFLRTLPDPAAVRRALANVPLRIHQDIILNDQMLVEAREDVLLLPAKTRYEQDDGGIETSTERRIMFSPEISRQVGEARAEWKILRDVALAARPENATVFGCADGGSVREEIARIVPYYDGVQHLRRTGDAIQYGGRHLCAGGEFPLPGGKARPRPVALPPRERPADRFFVSTRRGKQFNSLIYAETDPLNGAPRDAILMNASDADALGLEAGARVTLISAAGRYDGSVFLAPIAPGNLQVHWPEGNVLLAGDRGDRDAGTPDYNATVRVEKAA